MNPDREYDVGDEYRERQTEGFDPVDLFTSRGSNRRENHYCTSSATEQCSISTKQKHSDRQFLSSFSDREEGAWTTHFSR